MQIFQPRRETEIVSHQRQSWITEFLLFKRKDAHGGAFFARHQISTIFIRETRDKLLANGRQIPSFVSRGINCSTLAWGAIILVVIECSVPCLYLSLAFPLSYHLSFTLFGIALATVESSVRALENDRVNRIISTLALSPLTITRSRNFREDKVQARITLCTRPASSRLPPELSKILEHPPKRQLPRTTRD